MPRTTLPYSLSRPHQAQQPVPLMAALQAWLLVRDLHGGPHRLGRQPSAVKYKAMGQAGQQAKVLCTEVLQQINNIINF